MIGNIGHVIGNMRHVIVTDRNNLLQCGTDITHIIWFSVHADGCGREVFKT